MDLRGQPYYHNFDNLLDQIVREFKKLKNKNQTLNEENARLRQKLAQLTEAEQLPLGQLSDTERLTLRQQINGIIEKIDQYLEDKQS